MRLRAVVGRVESSWRPATAEEAFEIVRRRLFEPLGAPSHYKDRDMVARAFADLYRSQSWRSGCGGCGKQAKARAIAHSSHDHQGRDHPLGRPVSTVTPRDWSTRRAFPPAARPRAGSRCALLSTRLSCFPGNALAISPASSTPMGPPPRIATEAVRRSSSCSLRQLVSRWPRVCRAATLSSSNPWMVEPDATTAKWNVSVRGGEPGPRRARRVSPGDRCPDPGSSSQKALVAYGTADFAQELEETAGLKANLQHADGETPATLKTLSSFPGRD